MTPMEARDSMLAVFRDAWVAQGQDLDRVRWDDKTGSVPDGDAPWARVTLKHNDAPMRAFGDGVALYENTGTLFVQIFTAVGGANVDAYALSFAVVTAYRNVASEGVLFRKPRLKEVGVSGAFEQTNVLTDFSYN